MMLPSSYGTICQVCVPTKTTLEPPDHRADHEATQSTPEETTPDHHKTTATPLPRSHLHHNNTTIKITSRGACSIIEKHPAILRHQATQEAPRNTGGTKQHRRHLATQEAPSNTERHLAKQRQPLTQRHLATQRGTQQQRERDLATNETPDNT